MSIICPSVTAPDAQAYRQEMSRIAPFANRVHIDFSDGEFSPVRLVNLAQAYWPEGIIADLHLMYKTPGKYIETAISLNPQLITIQAEADGDLLAVIRELRAVGIKSGVCLLQETQPDHVRNLISEVDHVLIFSGDLGHHGGHADVALLKKVPHIRAINPNAEIGWDGGVNAQNVAQLALGGIEVLIAGGAIQQVDDAKQAYDQLVDAAAKANASQ